MKTADLVDLTKSDKVYILYDVFTTEHFAKPIQKRLAERAEAGEFAVAREFEKYLHTGFDSFEAKKSSANASSVATKDEKKGAGKVIEVLFPEFCNLFGDSSNIKYLKACLPDAEFKLTAFTEEPYFVKNKPDLIYLGAMTERKQEMVAGKLMQYKDRLAELRDAGTAMLFTSNAVEILGKYIEKDDGSRIDCLGLYDFSAKRSMMNRKNSLVRGFYKDTELVGFKTQFSEATDPPKNKAFFKVDKGMGMSNDSTLEGIHDKNLFATYLVGPFLALNPDFTKSFIRDCLKVEGGGLAYEKEIYDAYRVRVKEFHDPKCQY